MAKRNIHTFKTLKEEIKRKTKAKEKLDRCHGKRDQATEADKT